MNDFGVLFLIVVLIILLVINAKYNKGSLFSINTYSRTSRNLSDDSKTFRDVYGKSSKSGKSSKKNKSWFSYESDGEEVNNESDSDEYINDVDSDKSSSSVFRPKLIKKNNSINQNKVYDLSIASSKGSSVTCTTNDSSVLKPPKQDKDYYYLGKPEDTQLYHIFKNVYTFDEAKEECVKRNGVLADPQELANAYTSGANWCSWGWTSDGNAYLPSKTPECNKDVGLLNGKKIDPYLRLGTNCYGVPQ